MEALTRAESAESDVPTLAQELWGLAQAQVEREAQTTLEAARAEQAPELEPVVSVLLEGRQLRAEQLALVQVLEPQEPGPVVEPTVA